MTLQTVWICVLSLIWHHNKIVLPFVILNVLYYVHLAFYFKFTIKNYTIYLDIR